VALGSVYPNKGELVRILQETDGACKYNLGEFNEEVFAKIKTDEVLQQGKHLGSTI
jgi:hypothetical protein